MKLGPIQTSFRYGKVAGDNPLTVIRGNRRPLVLHSVHFDSVTDATAVVRKWAVRITIGGDQIIEIPGYVGQAASTTRAVFFIGTAQLNQGTVINNAFPPNLLIPADALVTVEPGENNQGADVTSNPIATFQEVLEW